jgi:hypothetical protein
MWGEQFRPDFKSLGIGGPGEDFRNPPCGAVFELVVSAFYSSCLSRVKTSRNSLLGAELLRLSYKSPLCFWQLFPLCNVQDVTTVNEPKKLLLLADVSPVQCTGCDNCQ